MKAAAGVAADEHVSAGVEGVEATDGREVLVVLERLDERALVAVHVDTSRPLHAADDEAVVATRVPRGAKLAQPAPRPVVVSTQHSQQQNKL